MVTPVSATNPVSLDTSKDITHSASARTSPHSADHSAASPPVRETRETTVTISTVSQILAMKQHGATPDQIAARLHLSVAEVEAQLGTTTSSPSHSQAFVLAALSGRHVSALAAES